MQYARKGLNTRIADALDAKVSAGEITYEIVITDHIGYQVTPGPMWADPKPPTLNMTPGETAEWLGLNR